LYLLGHLRTTKICITFCLVVVWFCASARFNLLSQVRFSLFQHLYMNQMSLGLLNDIGTCQQGYLGSYLLFRIAWTAVRIGDCWSHNVLTSGIHLGAEELMQLQIIAPMSLVEGLV
jgi:hypothetical protein